MMRKIIAASLALTLSAPAFADDIGAELREAEMCFPFGGAVKQYNKFAKLKPEQRDTVGVIPQSKLTLKNEASTYPERMFFRDGEVETDLIIDPDGNIPNIGELFNASEEVSLCTFDPSKAGTPKSENGIAFSLDMDVQFLKVTGYHDMATIEDGLKDGKSHYKKMAGAMSFMVPKFSHLMVVFDDDVVAEDRKFSAVKDGQNLDGIPSEIFCDEPMIDVDDLEDMGADGLRVEGGSYQLMPVPNAKMLARFTKCDTDDEDEAKAE